MKIDSSCAPLCEEPKPRYTNRDALSDIILFVRADSAKLRLALSRLECGADIFQAPSVERGSHWELLSINGVYAKMWRVQQQTRGPF